LKILHILPVLKKGGAENLVLMLSKLSLSNAANVSVLIGYSEDSIMLEKLKKNAEVNCISDAPISKPRLYIQSFRWIIANRAHILTFDIVHAHLTLASILSSFLYIYRRLLLKNSPKFVETNHSCGSPLNFVQLSLKKSLYFFRDGLAHINQTPTWEHFPKFKQMTCQVIYNGAPAQEKEFTSLQIKDYMHSIGFKHNSKFTVGTISRLELDREPSKFIKIFSFLNQKGPNNYNFIIGGSGSQEDKLKNLAASYGILENCIFTGYTDDPYLPLNLMDIFLSINVEGSTGLAGLESVQAGVPLVGIQWLNTYQSQPDDWVWSSADIESVAQKVNELRLDPKQLARLRIKQQEFAYNNFSEHQMLKNYTSFYKKVMVET
jgi:glycosyltransferase involved in cell wall biosynthesis